MHRTQILLKEHQYRALRAQARREGRSLSSLIRQAVSDFLGIDGGATAVEIKQAYRRLAHRYHPDKNQGDPHAAERFREITNAY